MDETKVGGISVSDINKRVQADIAARAAYDKAEYANADRSQVDGQRFVSDFVPAWHEKGKVIGRTIYADEAWRELGPYDVRAIPLHRPDGTPTTFRELVKVEGEGQDEKIVQSFGSVSKDYELISPAEFIGIYADKVNRPVSTMVALKEGRVLSVATLLPDIDIKGDPVESYMTAANGMDGSHALTIMVSPIRVVCRNTLIAAKKMAADVYTIRHDERARDKVGRWMGEAVTRAERRVVALRDAFNTFAEFKPNEEQVAQVIAATYRLPKRPVAVGSASSAAEADKKDSDFERDTRKVLRLREEMRDIFENDTDLIRGMQIPELKRSGWHLFNAATYKATHDVGRADEDREYNVLFGNRADISERAFNGVYELATGHAVTKVR